MPSKQPPTSIPVIDISPFWTAGSAEEERLKVVADVKDACENIGFLIIKGHPVQPSTVDAALDTAHEFFKLPLEKKYEYMAEREIALYTGYVGGRGSPKYKGGVIKGSESDSSRDHEGPRGEKALSKDGDLRETYRINRYPRGLENNIFPGDDTVPGFKESWMEYYSRVEEFGKIMLQIIAVALELPEDYFVKFFDNHPSNLMSALYFPTAEDEPNNRKGAHTDAGIFTILLQDSSPGYGAGGLQVQTVNDVWIDVPVVEGAYVLNIGDTLMRWTNDRFLSSMHRVANVNLSKPRHSFIFFQQPNPDTVIECLPTCLGSEGAKYPPIVSQKYFEEKMTKTYL